jgi:hypothetical protein
MTAYERKCAVVERTKRMKKMLVRMLVARGSVERVLVLVT